MNKEDVLKAVLEAEEIKLKAQLRAIREVLKSPKPTQDDDNNKRISQVEYVYKLLKSVKSPLHISKIIELCKGNYGIELYRESIVSALLKKINRMDRFIKTDPNTFGLIEYRDLYKSQKQED